MIEPIIETDEATRRLMDGDPAALASLFEQNRTRLLRMVTIRMDRRLKGRIDEADILQDAYVVLTKKIDSYDGEFSPYIWMRLTVIDQLIAAHRTHIRARKRDARREVSMSQKACPDESSAEIAATLADSYSSVGGKVARAEVAELIKSTLASMEEKDREIIILRIFEGTTNAEAAEVLGLTPNGASSRFSRAMDRLQKEVIKQNEQ